MKHIPAVYLSGPMTGWPEYNRVWFMKTAERFTRLGWIVFNPYVFWGEGWLQRIAKRCPTLAWYVAMVRDLAVLIWARLQYQSFSIYLHRQWYKSRGATVERRVAVACGMPEIEEETNAVYNPN